jgi:hypothetical protein
VRDRTSAGVVNAVNGDAKMLATRWSPNKLDCRRVMSYGPSKGWCLLRMTKIRR